MAWDFETEPEFEAKLQWMRDFIERELIPLEPIAAHDRSTFAIVPPWLKEVWRDPEASGTN